MIRESEALLAELLEAGADEDAVAELLEDLFDWRVIFPGPGGQVAEAIDGSAWRFVLHGIGQLWRRIRAWHKDPDRREAARVRRGERRARRQARR